jgi:hypothetical protein
LAQHLGRVAELARRVLVLRALPPRRARCRADQWVAPLCVNTLRVTRLGFTVPTPTPPVAICFPPRVDMNRLLCSSSSLLPSEGQLAPRKTSFGVGEGSPTRQSRGRGLPEVCIPVLLRRTAAVDAARCGVAVFYVSTVLPRFARDGAHHRISPHCAARPHSPSPHSQSPQPVPTHPVHLD